MSAKSLENVKYRPNRTALTICLLVGSIWHPTFAQKPPVAAAATETQGVTREQADAILAELRQIRQLLDKQQQDAVQQIPSKVQISVASSWHAIGRDDAPVTILEFTDLQCPFCRQFHEETFPMIKKNYIDTGKVRFVSRDMPLKAVHPYAQKAAEAVRCAGDQGKYWELRNAILEIPDLN
jgi:protein-disulfide isomerase